MNPMQNSNLDDVSSMEQEAKYTIITLEDEETDSQAKQIFTDVQDKLNTLYSEFRIWLKENQESEKVAERKAWLTAESDKLLASAKVQTQKLKENENLQDAIRKGGKLANDTGSWIVDTLQDGVHEVMKNETVQKITTNVDDVIHQVKHDERVKQGVTSFKKGTLKLAESAFKGLKKVLDTESEIEVQNDEKNNDL